jgi:16S rRNA (cytosine1402-N4)-methyltransferase
MVPGHVSVLLDEVLAYLLPAVPDPLMVDATLGLAGHAMAFLERYPGLRLIGVDADPEIQAIARSRLLPYGDRVRLVNSFFDVFFAGLRADMGRAAEGGAGGSCQQPDVILFDFGLSMYHFKEAKRGFSLQVDQELDMRLDPETGRTASELVNDCDERELARLFVEYGEEPFARQIARAIVRERSAAAVTTTARLADIVRGAVPSKVRHGRIHPATRVFQALRIAVNDELGRISRALDDAIACLSPGGVIGAISFHSLEDRIVKQQFREHLIRKGGRDKYRAEQDTPIPVDGAKRGLEIITKRPIQPGDAEQTMNPASRSAKLRVARVPK